MPSTVLSKGDVVLVSGLIRSARLNGRLGKVVSVPKDQRIATAPVEDMRYGVQILGEEKPLGIKLSNISLVNIKSENAPTFQIGDQVDLHGLTTAKFNGRSGVVVKGPDPSNEDRYGVRMDKGNQVLSIKIANLRIHVKTTKELEIERNNLIDVANPTREEALDADQLALLRQFTNASFGEDGQNPLYGRRVDALPDFIAELEREGGGYPIGVDRRWASKHLRESFENASALPHGYEWIFKQPEYKPDAKDIIRRIRSTDEDKVNWYLSPREPGDIYTNRVAPAYTGTVRHNYSNQTYRSEVLQQGSTHVAIGFVDLGILLVAELRPPDDPGNRDPLRFVGVERSAFCVAKTYVIWELIRECAGRSEDQSKGLLNSILQVWFSSTWTADTEDSVRKALSLLCRSDRTHHPDVRRMLEHWKCAPSMSLEDARKAHVRRTPEARSFIGKMKSTMDRIAMARYELTGDFAVPNESPLHGSIIMFDCPEFTPPCVLDENVFAALEFRRIVQIADNSGKAASMSILQAAEESARDGVKKMVSWCKSGQVEVELVCSTLEASIDLIASKRPQTMSWSNMLDYMEYEDFHDAARRCSRHGNPTLHFGYSMNWQCDVWATSVIDYLGPGYVHDRAEIIDQTNRDMPLIYRALGWDTRISLPLRQNPITTTSPGLEAAAYADWSMYFFDHGRTGGRPCHIRTIDHPIPCPLSATGGSTIYLAWTY